MRIDNDVLHWAIELAGAKRREAEAKAEKIAAEEGLIGALDFKRPSGQETYDRESTGGDTCRVVLKQPINTKVDAEAWRKLRAKLPAKHPGRDVFVGKFSLDAKAAKALQDSDAKAWAEVSKVVTRTPGKVSVELMEITLGSPLKIDPTKRVGVLGPNPPPVEGVSRPVKAMQDAMRDVPLPSDPPRELGRLGATEVNEGEAP